MRRPHPEFPEATAPGTPRAPREHIQGDTLRTTRTLVAGALGIATAIALTACGGSSTDAADKKPAAVPRVDGSGKTLTVWNMQGDLTDETLKAINADWIKSGKIRILFQWTSPSHPDLKDYPVVESLAKSKADLQALDLLTSRLSVGRPFISPPGVPRERLEALRHAFDMTMKDPGFLADAERAKLDIDGVTGQELSDIVSRVSATPRDVVERVRSALDGK